jgi:hypothetical protein
MRILAFLVLVIFGLQVHAQRPSALKNGKFFERNDHQMLFGGKASDHFIIDNLDLNPEQFHYGLGREAFPALLEPKFESVLSADKNWMENDRFLVARKGGETKAYSVRDLTRHEVVNDVIDGEPIFAAYCILADLGAIYKRTYGDKVFTFAVSGYTYYDPKIWNGLDGFILWDRETESLWWPLIDKAVSGQLKNVPLLKLEEVYWEDTTWKEVKKNYPVARVMISGQDFVRPSEWKRYKDVSEIVSGYTKN